MFKIWTPGEPEDQEPSTRTHATSDGRFESLSPNSGFTARPLSRALPVAGYDEASTGDLAGDLWLPTPHTGGSGILGRSFPGIQDVDTDDHHSEAFFTDDNAVPSAESNRELTSNNELVSVFDDIRLEPQLLESPTFTQALDSVLNNLETNSGLGSYKAIAGTHQESFQMSLSMTHCPMPWPPDMLSSPERRFLWQYFLHITKDGFLCLDEQNLSRFQGSQDPFIAIIPQMAISNESLRSAIFCFAAFQYNTNRSGDEFHQLVRDCSRRASVALKSELPSLGAQSWSLFSIVACGIFLHHFGQDDSEYLHYASTLAVGYFRRPQSSSHLLAPFIQLILSMLRWSIISTVCSFQISRKPVSDKIYRGLEMRREEVEHNYLPSFRDWTNHPIYAFSPRLVNPLLRLARLLDIQKSRSTVNNCISDASMGMEMIKLEEELLTAREADLDLSKTGTTDPKELRSLNEAMHAAAFLLFYARLKGMPFTAPLVRKKVQVIVSEIGKIPVTSRVSHAVLFPLFIAGCEAVEGEGRRRILERLRTPRGLTYNRKDVCLSLEHVWQVRDLDPGSRWPDWFYKCEWTEPWLSQDTNDNAIVEPDFCIDSLF